MNVVRDIGARGAAGPYWDWDPGVGIVVGHDELRCEYVLVRWLSGGSTYVRDNDLVDAPTREQKS